MTLKEFLNDHCICCGGNWVEMFCTGCRKLWPDDFAVLEDSDEFQSALDGMIQLHFIMEFLRSKGVTDV
jgi:hypothetical protein